MCILHHWLVSGRGVVSLMTPGQNQPENYGYKKSEFPFCSGAVNLRGLFPSYEKMIPLFLLETKLKAGLQAEFIEFLGTGEGTCAKYRRGGSINSMVNMEDGGECKSLLPAICGDHETSSTQNLPHTLGVFKPCLGPLFGNY